MPTVPYRDLLLPRLQDPIEAAHYLTACLEEGDEVFLIGLRNVVDAHGGMAHLAEATSLDAKPSTNPLRKQKPPPLDPRPDSRGAGLR